jgi:hypothetical protein
MEPRAWGKDEWVGPLVGRSSDLCPPFSGHREASRDREADAWPAGPKWGWWQRVWAWVCMYAGARAAAERSFHASASEGSDQTAAGSLFGGPLRSAWCSLRAHFGATALRAACARRALGAGRGRAREKGIWWMPWHREAMKDVARCEKPRGGASARGSSDLRMGQPTAFVRYPAVNP